MPNSSSEPTKNQSEEKPRPFGEGHTLIGKDYTTPDMVPKVTGRAKYAEDFRADGMLFCRLVLSPMPHARIKSIDASEALAMPGVKGILTPDDIPAPADTITDRGTVIKASKWGERALAREPVYEGEPILVVAAVDELTCAEAIEKIKIEFEELPFVQDPLDSLRPNGPNPREDGNVWITDPAVTSTPLLKEVKWSEEDFKEYEQGRLPMGKAPDEWSYGDVEAGFKNAALVLDETFVTPDVSHVCLEPRTAMAYWQNGKLYIHSGTQSTYQTLGAIARWMNIDAKDIVFISEYTGGGFGSKVTAGISMIIPAILSKKLNAPVMMRISREEETYIGRARSSFQGRMKIGFAANGRITAIDMFVICNCGAYDPQLDTPTSGRISSLLYQAPAMRWRGIAVMTNTPARSAQSSPGGMQAITITDPIVAKAARRLGIDQVEIRRINCPEGKAEYGPFVQGKRAHVTSSFLKTALERGAEQFKWKERVARPKRSGTKLRGVGVASSCYVGGTKGFDGLLVVTPEGRIRFHSGIGHLGTWSVIDVHRAGAEVLGVSWDQCDVVWGDTSKGLPYTCISGGSQTTHAMTRAAYAVGLATRDRLKEVAAKAHGGIPDNFDVVNGHVIRKGGGQVMSLAEAAKKAIELGGIYDGHQPPDDVNQATKQAVSTLAGQGLVVAARDNFPRDGDTYSYVASFAEVEVDVETGKYYLTDFLVYSDVGTVVHPTSFGGQVLGRSILGIAHAIGQKWVFDPAHGKMVSKRFHHHKPPTILDLPVDMKWNALNIPDPETPVGARGVGEPPVGGGCAAVLNAMSDALGDEVFQRAPVNPDVILASLEAGRPMQHPLLAHI